MYALIFSFVFIGLVVSNFKGETVYVTKRIIEGDIRGETQKIEGKNVDHFLGIPFGKPPIGSLRFRYPEPAANWTGVKDTLTQPNSCLQYPPSDYDKMNLGAKMWIPNTPLSEDCLYLNVWAPSTGSNLPVMVWIYGGSFYLGTSTLQIYNGSVLASKENVVVVSLQYRLGPLGFLYFGNTDAPGNQALMDQRLALIWIKNNIASFGGDPDLVTIFGESSGAVGVSLHILSPLSQSYFKHGILQSGTFHDCSWGIDSSSEGLRKSRLVAKSVKCTSSDQTDLMKCLRDVPADQLAVSQFDVLTTTTARRGDLLKASGLDVNGRPTNMYFEVPLKPVIDRYFIPSNPKEIFKQWIKKDMKLLMGTNKNEGMYFFMYGLSDMAMTDAKTGGVNLPTKLDKSGGEDPYDVVAANILPEAYLDPLYVPIVLQEYDIPSAKLGYRTWNSTQVMQAFDNLGGDLDFKCPVIMYAENMADLGSTIYMYSFEKRTNNLPWPAWAGTMHGYELEYVFGTPYNTRFQQEFYTFNAEEKAISDKVMRYWANFARTGNPNDAGTQTWQPYTTSERKYLIIDGPGTNFKTGTNIRYRQCKFWNYTMPLVKKAYLSKVPNKISGTTPTSRMDPLNTALLILGTLLLKICF